MASRRMDGSEARVALPSGQQGRFRSCPVEALVQAEFSCASYHERSAYFTRIEIIGSTLGRNKKSQSARRAGLEDYSRVHHDISRDVSRPAISKAEETRNTRH